MLIQELQGQLFAEAWVEIHSSASRFRVRVNYRKIIAALKLGGRKGHSVMLVSSASTFPQFSVINEWPNAVRFRILYVIS